MRLPAMDAMYQQALALAARRGADGAVRPDERLIFDYAPWILTNYPYLNIVAQPWLKGYKHNAFIPQQWWYYDVAAH